MAGLFSYTGAPRSRLTEGQVRHSQKLVTVKLQKLIGPLVGCLSGGMFIFFGLFALFFGAVGNYQANKHDLPLTPFAELKTGDQVRLEATLADEEKLESFLMGQPCAARQVKVSAMLETWNDTTESTSVEARQIWLEQKGPENLTFTTQDGGTVLAALDKIQAAGSNDTGTQDELPEIVPKHQVPPELLSEASYYKIEELIFTAGPVFYLRGKAGDLSQEGVLVLEEPKVFPGSQEAYINNMKTGAKIGTWAGIGFIVFGLVVAFVVHFVVTLVLKHFAVIEE